MKRFFEHFLFLNLWIAIGVFLLCAESFIFFSSPINYTFLVFVFFGTLFIYNLHRYFINCNSVEEKEKKHNKWIAENRKKILFIILLSAIVISFLLLYFSKTEIFYLIPVAITSFLYSIGSNKILRGIREIPYLKIFIICFSWGYVTGFLPGIFSGISYSEIYPVFLMKTLFAFCVYIPFEIRDMNEDPPSFKTLPQVIGVNGSFLTGILFLFLFALISFNYSFTPFMTLAAVCLLTFTGLLLSKRKKSEMFYFLFIDSLLVLKPLFSLVAIKLL